MKVEITKAQLQAIADCADDMEAMLGNGGDIEDPVNGDPDKHWRKRIKLIDNFLAKNGYKR